MINNTISKPAADLIKIACYFGNFNIEDVLLKCLIKSNRKINITTVENILQEIQDKWELQTTNHEQRCNGV